MAVTDLFDAFAAAVCWAAVVYRLPTLRRGGSPRAFWLALVPLAGAQTVWISPIYTSVGRLSGIPNLAWILSAGLVLVCGHSLVTYLLRLTAPTVARRASRRLGGLLAAAFAVVVGLFAAADIDQDSPDFVARYSHLPAVAACVLVYLAAVLLFLIPLVRQYWSLAATATGGLRAGLRLLTMAGFAGFAYVIHRAGVVIAHLLGIHVWPGEPNTITRVLIAGTITLGTLGAVLPVGARALRLWVGRYRAYRQLYPLWRALQPATGQVAPLSRPRSWLADALIPLIPMNQDLDDRIHLRIVGIRDGRLALRPFINPDLADIARQQGRAAGLDGEDLEALVEAAVLADAIHTQTNQHPLPTTHPAVTAPGAPIPPDADDVTYLGRVAAHLPGHRSSTPSCPNAAGQPSLIPPHQ